MSMLAYLATTIGAFMAPKVLATLGTVLGLILADFICGVLAAIKQGKFTWSKLGQYVQTSLVPYMGGLLVLALFSGSNAALATLFFTIATTVTVKFLADITNKVSALFGGISIQLQSPFQVTRPNNTTLTDPVVSPETKASTDTPAAKKIIPDEPKDESVSQ